MSQIDIPAIRGYMGNHVYYTATFTFQQIADLVKSVDNELHTSNSLKEQIQRSLTANYVSIKNYILSQKDHFFNALVLAIYEGDPTWNELEIDFKGIDYYTMGFLRLTGEEKIFPVDGQHRVKGIKEALKEMPDLAKETITVILIGHHNDKEGMERTRRIFSTLNRYAKPVKPGDIIALDEDDTVAIVTRNMLEEYPLFMNDNIKADLKGSKALSEKDVKSFTSLLTLYDTNKIIYKYYKSETDKQKKPYNSKAIDNFLRCRPEQNELDKFEKYLCNFWDMFIDSFPGMKEYLETSEKDDSAANYRNKEIGGLLYFRPVALPFLVKAILEIHFFENVSLKICMERFSKVELTISNHPWVKVLWNPVKATMKTSNKSLILPILMCLYDKSKITDKLINNYAKALAITVEEAKKRLVSC